MIKLLSPGLVFLVMLSGCSKEPETSSQVPAAAETAAPSAAPVETAPVPVLPEPEVDMNTAGAGADAPQNPAGNPAADEMQATPAQEAASSEPETHTVKGVITQWQPLVLFAQPGDSVTFTNMTGHDTQNIDGLIPPDAPPWQSKLGEEAFTITLPVAGAYVYKCNPHITTGMVGVFIVGDPDAVDLDALLDKAGEVKVGRNMVQRAIRKAKKALPSG